MNIADISDPIKKFRKKLAIYSILSLVGFPIALWSDLYLFICQNLLVIDRVIYSGIVIMAGSALSITLILTDAFKCLPKCPSCDKKFYIMQAQVVIATKNCPYCGDKVISDVT